MSGERVGVLGAAADDEVVLEDGRELRRAGGTPLYAARALRAAGATPVAIETGRVQCRIHHTPGGTRQSILSLPAPLDADGARRLLPQLAGCSWVLLGGQTAGDFPPETIATLAGAGLHVCLDGQGLARGSHIGVIRLEPIDPARLAGVSALKLNAAEAEAAGPVAVDELLISRAEQGCTITAAGVETSIAGNGRRFKDPTGAGDSLCALYCLGRTRGAPPAAAARWAQGEVERLYGT
jgi:sugar/nucleoside kinase (ribokinase family)